MRGPSEARTRRNYYRATTNQVVADGGRWPRYGATLALNRSDGSLSYTGRMVGTTLSLADPTFSYTFAK